MEVFFEEELSAGIIDAISKLHFEHIEELRFSDVEDVPQSIQDSSMNIVTEEAENVREEQDKEPADSTKSPEKGESRKTKAKKVPQIDEVGKMLMDNICKEATSFDDFVQRAMDFLELKPYYRDFFTCVIEIASKVSSVSWDEIQEAMKEAGYDFSISKQVALTRAVKAKFDENGSTSRALTFISEMIKYKDYGFESSHVELVHDEAIHEEASHDESSHELVAKEKPQFTIISSELVNEAMKKNSYFDRVGCIFDRIRTDRFDDDTYADYRGRIVDTLVSAAADNSENPQMSANDCVFFFIGKNFSSNQAHVVRAMVFQSIKDYAHSRGYEGNAYTQHFLKDLRMLL
jgi:hypothetical protein